MDETLYERSCVRVISVAVCFAVRSVLMPQGNVDLADTLMKYSALPLGSYMP